MSLWIMYNNENFTMLRLKSFNKYLYIYSFNFLGALYFASSTFGVEMQHEWSRHDSVPIQSFIPLGRGTQ